MSKARAVRPELLTLLVSLAFLLFYNLPLWQRLLAITPGGWQGLGMMLAVGLMIAAIFNLALTLLAFRWLLKPALTLLILAAAGTTYFMTQYGVLMDVGMLRNVMQTNPRLKAEEGLINFSNVHSCGTETAVSVPCMFSNLGRADYSDARARTQEGLLDVLQRAGLRVLWRDNQSGCKGTCDRVAFQDLSESKDPALCDGGECHDEILLRDLQAFIDGLQQDTVLVLHQMGSHGPAYFKRYPREYEKFTPVCASNDFSACSRDSIINGYDNTLLYTDHVLASLIDLLRKNEERIDTGMLYLSDHGESLGEYNLYLHGTPYLLAPDQQKHVGMLAWFSPGYQSAFGLDSGCLRQRSNEELSQDNLFHSMLGLLEVRTGAYDPGLDLFAPCRAPEVLQALKADGGRALYSEEASGQEPPAS